MTVAEANAGANAAPGAAADIPDGGRSVLIFNLGATQEFVSQARRTQDLWMGSFLVSYLTWQALKVVIERYGNSAVLMPSIDGHPFLAVDPPGGKKQKVDWQRLVTASLPNVFTAVVQTGDVPSLAHRMVCAIDRSLVEVARSIHERLSTVWKETTPSDIWQNQWAGLRQRLGCYWGSCEVGSADAFRADPHGWLEVCSLAAPGVYSRYRPPANWYGLASRAAAAAVARRKQVRDFCLPVHTSGGSRCSQCGLRQSVSPTWSDIKERRLPERTGNGWKIKITGRIRPGDELCAVCLGRRFCWEQYFLPKYVDGTGDVDAHLLFPSTASIATAPFKVAVVSKWERLRELANRVVAESEEDQERQYPGIAPRLKELLDTSPQRARDEIGRFLRLEGDRLTQPLPGAAAGALFRAAAAEGVDPPSSYYAILAADGDEVGEWVRGGMMARLRDDLRELADPLPTERFHAEFAAAMAKFADEAVALIHRAGPGRCLYAGGDDLLALVPLKGVLQLVEELRATFSSSRMSLVAPGGGSAIGTLSAAVLFVHHGESLSGAIEAAHSLLRREAKARGRDRLCVAMKVRGADPFPLTVRWQLAVEATSASSPHVLGELTEFFALGVLSPRLIRAMVGYVPVFASGDDECQPLWDSGARTRRDTAQRALLERLIERHTADRGTALQIGRLLAPLVAAGDQGGQGNGWALATAALRLTQFLARER